MRDFETKNMNTHKHTLKTRKHDDRKTWRLRLEDVKTQIVNT